MNLFSEIVKSLPDFPKNANERAGFRREVSERALFPGQEISPPRPPACPCSPEKPDAAALAGHGPTTHRPPGLKVTGHWLQTPVQGEASPATLQRTACLTPAMGVPGWSLASRVGAAETQSCRLRASCRAPSTAPGLLLLGPVPLGAPVLPPLGAEGRAGLCPLQQRAPSPLPLCGGPATDAHVAEW